jgi:hypothetical protein
MIVYSSAGIYIDECGSDLKERVRRINLIIDALETSALDAASNAGITGYNLDDGQTKINQTYRSPEEITRSIVAFESIKQRYINKINGSVVRLVDGRNMTRFNNGRY